MLVLAHTCCLGGLSFQFYDADACEQKGFVLTLVALNITYVNTQAACALNSQQDNSKSRAACNDWFFLFLLVCQMYIGDIWLMMHDWPFGPHIMIYFSLAFIKH